jgi:hypothetical protein
MRVTYPTIDNMKLKSIYLVYLALMGSALEYTKNGDVYMMHGSAAGVESATNAASTDRPLFFLTELITGHLRKVHAVISNAVNARLSVSF